MVRSSIYCRCMGRYVHHGAGDRWKGGRVMKCKIKIIKEVVDIFPWLQPKVGQIYDADLSPRRKKTKGGEGKAEFCIIDVLGKKIALRKGEYEIVGYSNG